jgi:hypothetical protein
MNGFLVSVDVGSAMEVQEVVKVDGCFDREVVWWFVKGL